MLRNYFFIAFRNLQRNSIYTFINIAGLSVGLACSLLILLWVADEMSFDRFHKNFDRLYQVCINEELSESIETSPSTPYPMLDALKTRSSQIKRVSLTNNGEGFLLAAGENKVSKMCLAVTEDFLGMFSFKMLKGDPSKALMDPHSIVLTTSTAKALFGEEDPLHKLVKIENMSELKVTGVMEDVPAQSTFQFDFLLPSAYYESTYEWVRSARENWNNRAFKIYVELQPDADVSQVNNAIKDLVKENNEQDPLTQVFLHPMANWRLYSEFTNGKVSGGQIEYVRMFGLIGIFTLVIACINFMNLATARSQSRAREVGIRKSVGSRKNQLVMQFLGESLLVTALAFILAIGIVELVLPYYNVLVNKNLMIQYSNPILWMAALGIILVTGVVSGSYPAFYLSAFQPVKVLKGKVDVDKGSANPRKILVAVQFGFSIFLIVGAVVVYQQIMHVKARYTGYDRENLMLIWTTSDVEKNFQSIRDELKQTGVVKAVCKSSAPITRIFSRSEDVTWPGKLTESKVSFITMATEYDFAETMGVKLLEGRDFSPDFKSDTSAVMINKAALDLMGLTNPLGVKINLWGNDRTIIGVMDNVIMDSPYRPVEPLALVFIPDWSSTISVRLEKTSDVAAAVSKVEKVFKTYDPEHPLWYRFADAEFATKFASINLVGQLAWIFTLLAILISSLGLFGLAAFMAQQKTKEIGIRKVLGATVSSLLVLNSKEFIKLVIFAFLVSAPIAWLVLHDFLQKYAYRITIAWWILPAAGFGVLVLSFIIVSAQVFQAAKHNPVDSLRSE